MSRPRLYVHVEGETEENFVKEVLDEWLRNRGYGSVVARIIGEARQRNRRGGICGWDSVSRSILRHMRQDPGSLHTTIVDYYALPSAGSRAWPGRKAASTHRGSSQERAQIVQAALADFMVARMPAARTRFEPFVVMHEFEGLLFSDPVALASALGAPELTLEFTAILGLFDTPEDINDSSETTPSKRISEHAPSYDKTFHGPMAALEMGLPTIRQHCPHFGDWLTRLEAHAASQ